MSKSNIATQLRVSEDKLDYLGTLNDEQLEALNSQLSSARKAQHAHVKDAAVEAINQLPRLVRRPLLKMFEGL